MKFLKNLGTQTKWGGILCTNPLSNKYRSRKVGEIAVSKFGEIYVQILLSMNPGTWGVKFQ